MNEVFDFLFASYKEYSTFQIGLEVVGLIFGTLSVIFSARNSIWVYPTGIISTIAYVYLLYQWELFGDLIINAYYFIMSIYGWILWSKKDKEHHDLLKISSMNAKDNLTCVGIFTISAIFVASVYIYFDKFTAWWSYIDNLTTALCFIGMWLLAKRKIENWIFLIIADIISIPLYFIKGYTLSSILYLILTIIAIFGYLSWKKTLQNNIQPA
ncbi:nicotinamide riboside transporter PnuC [Flavobacterium rakeshii]|uniref:Nicotinamide riboside transporter PnuC n=1 Tax=Flavobacterium rakeshii TaxID=1038845 RepID=A0A6N8HG86_9FLAO|nr:nicotinamide riboside transporter PnuC [Flavobacterium rakeshii]MEE1897659.1 nicotinamide riboside transporter PnuC [Flavobacterium rakeshii]MUV04749.1 nicotinamide riboside transporter PnuC [Flavobacterium rakeshii]